MEGRGCDLIIVAPVPLPSRSDPVWSSGRGSGHPRSGPSPAVASDPGAGVMTTGTQTNPDDTDQTPVLVAYLASQHEAGFLVKAGAAGPALGEERDV
jgi:hypothetical protein